MEPYYDEGFITIYHGDAREVMGDLFISGDLAGGEAQCLIVDPPYDDEGLLFCAAQWREVLLYPPTLVFTDPRYFGLAVRHFGEPAWVFTWDTMSSWNVGPHRPLTQTKFALWYGDRDSYDRDAVLWGAAPPVRDHPSTKQDPLDGRRLTDLWRESLRWLHHPEAGSGSTGTERFSSRQGDPALRHAKPVGWLRCLIGNVSAPGLVVDPFMGSGTSLRAVKDLGYQAIGIDVDEQACAVAVDRLAQEVFDFGGAG